MPSRDQIKAAIASAGGSMSEDELLHLVPAGERGDLVQELKAMEEDGELDCRISVTWGVLR